MKHGGPLDYVAFHIVVIRDDVRNDGILHPLHSSCDSVHHEYGQNQPSRLVQLALLSGISFTSFRLALALAIAGQLLFLHGSQNLRTVHWKRRKNTTDAVRFNRQMIECQVCKQNNTRKLKFWKIWWQQNRRIGIFEWKSVFQYSSKDSHCISKIINSDQIAPWSIKNCSDTFAYEEWRKMKKWILITYLTFSQISTYGLKNKLIFQYSLTIFLLLYVTYP